MYRRLRRERHQFRQQSSLIDKGHCTPQRPIPKRRRAHEGQFASWKELTEAGAGARRFVAWHAHCAAKTARCDSFSYSATVRASQFLLAALTLSVVAVAAPRSTAWAADADNGWLRGPHPFLKPNALQISGGYSAVSGGAIGGLKLKTAFEYELLGSLWLNLHVSFVDGTDKPIDARACNSCGRMADAMGGLSYRLRMPVPVIVTGTLSGGFLFVFPDEYASAMGVGARAAVAARYYFFDWLGFGLELANTVGFVSHEKASGLSRGLAILDALAGVEIQFDTP
jgi:hypothetical protein